MRRSLDNRFIEKRRTGRHPWNSARRPLAPSEWRALVEGVRAAVAVVSASLPSVPDARGLSAAARERLAGAQAWTPDRLATEAGTFASAYHPVPILPPDQYRAVVVQVTEGCSYNRCAHCRFYRERAFHAKSPAELETHLSAVRAFFGEGLSLRRTVFLGDANALVLPPAWLHQAFDCLHARLASHVEAWGVASFIDAFSGAPRSVEHFASLRRRGLRRVYVGVETGCDQLLAFLHKPGTATQAHDLIARLKAAGLSVGVIVMLGIGGRDYADRHLRETAALLAGLPLGEGDLLYLSPLVADGDSPYRGEEQAAGISPADDAELARQHDCLHGAARPGVKRALYDIRDFLY